MHRILRSVAIAALFVSLAVIAPSRAEAASTDTVWGLTGSNAIVKFLVGTPGTILQTKSVSGLQSGEDLLGIDVRPANGKLYGLGSTSRIYVIDPNSGAAHAVSSTPFTPTLNGTEFGFDFNPAVDRIRIVSDGDQNLRINPDTGVTVATDTTLAYAVGDTNVGANPNVVGAAYTNNVDGAATTTLFDLDNETDVLATQNPPNGGILNTVGATGVDFPSVTGFDIGADASALALGTVLGTSTLYSVNLTSGAATSAGTVGTAIEDLAIKLPQPDGDGYVLGAFDGGAFNYGSAQFKGSAGSLDLNAPVIDIENRSTGQGYWMLALDGGIFNYGDAQFFGSAGSVELNEPTVGLAAHPSNKGYWLVASDGGVFAYGAAQFYGSMGGQPLNEEIVGIASTVTGKGYWLFAADGGVFAFGDASFYGSAGSIDLNAPVLGGEAAADGSGYYMVAADGGVFNYGSAQFAGSAGSVDLNAPVIKMAVDPDGRGYWLVAADGGVFSYDAAFKGSAGAIKLNAPIVGIAAK